MSHTESYRIVMHNGNGDATVVREDIRWEWEAYMRAASASIGPAMGYRVQWTPEPDRWITCAVFVNGNRAWGWNSDSQEYNV